MIIATMVITRLSYSQHSFHIWSEVNSDANL